MKKCARSVAWRFSGTALVILIGLSAAFWLGPVAAGAYNRTIILPGLSPSRLPWSLYQETVTKSVGNMSVSTEESLAPVNIALITSAVILGTWLVMKGIKVRERSYEIRSLEYRVRRKKARWQQDFMTDFHPRSWISKYQRNSVKYVLLLAVYYHALGYALAVGVEEITVYVDPSHETPNLPFSFIDAVMAGPFEETLFFGIPFYLSGNPVVGLVIGIVWALIHIFNTEVFMLSGLAFGNFVFAFLSLFYSLRTWASGKGWLSILVHSGWNAMMFAIACGMGENPCSITGSFGGTTYMLAMVIGAEVMLLITLFLYSGSIKTRMRVVSMSKSALGSATTIQVSGNRPSRVWYIVPILLGIIGGLIMYFVLRKRDRKMADRGLIVGTIALLINIVLGLLPLAEWLL